MSPLRFARGYDRRMNQPGPLATAMRFAMSVPGQILVNTAAFTLPEELRMGQGWRVLDIGCGRAGVVRVVAHRAHLLQTPVGLDASQRVLSMARRDIEAQGGPPVCLVQGIAPDLPFHGESFDLLLSSHAFRYLSDDELRACLTDARRVLKPGGLFLAWEFAPTSSGLLDRWNHWVLTRGVSPVRLRGYGELRALGQACGFDWVEHAWLRPFLLPPIPRVSLIMGRAPEGWRSTVVDGRRVLSATAAEA